MFLLLFCTVQPVYGEATNTPSIPTVVASESVTSEVNQASFDCATVSEIPFIECNALVVLYRATNGQDWRNNDGWLADNTPCDWFGLECRERHISKLYLDENLLVGTLPPELGDLSQLNNNQLRGTLPPSLGKLTQVTWLRLEANELSGTIPPELGNMTALESLYLSDNQLTGTIPPTLGNLPNLKKLYLYLLNK